jgi:hypothetical protein
MEFYPLWAGARPAAGSAALLWYNVHHPFDGLEEITRTMGSVPCAI